MLSECPERMSTQRLQTQTLVDTFGNIQFAFCVVHCCCFITARALATYLIPGCVGRGVRLGSESLSGGGADGVWKSGDLEFWELGDLGIWKSGNLEIWGFGNQESRGPKNKQNKQISKLESILPKTSARSGLVGKKPRGSHLGPS